MWILLQKPNLCNPDCSGILLYADETILLSENPEDFQHLLDVFFFLDIGKSGVLRLTVKNNKFLIFGRG